MTTISEDYVNFEVSKLLKEKGFIEDCLAYYNKVGDLVEATFKFNWNFQTIDYSAPTLQMVLKHLRKEHKLCIVSIPVVTDDDGEYVINITEGLDNRWILTYDHYEKRNHSFYGLSTGADNLIDVCYELILKLHELNLL